MEYLIAFLFLSVLAVALILFTIDLQSDYYSEKKKQWHREGKKFNCDTCGRKHIYHPVFGKDYCPRLHVLQLNP